MIRRAKTARCAGGFAASLGKADSVILQGASQCISPKHGVVSINCKPSELLKATFSFWQLSVSESSFCMLLLPLCAAARCKQYSCSRHELRNWKYTGMPHISQDIQKGPKAGNALEYSWGFFSFCVVKSAHGVRGKPLVRFEWGGDRGRWMCGPK